MAHGGRGLLHRLVEEGDAAASELAALVRSDATLPAAARLDVYANAYFLRIHECLENDFPALRWALGADWFHDLATAYLAACPPTRPSLRHAGDRLPDFVASHAGAAPFRRGHRWLADLALLERAIVDAFDAADATPDTSPLGREDLAGHLRLLQRIESRATAT